MLTFIQKCGATSETAEDLCNAIMNTKKPSNLHFEDLKQWLEELNDYLLYLPGPLNQHLGDDQLFVTLKKCVHAWQKNHTDSNAHKNIDNVNDLANYYGNLETQEKKEHNQENWHRNRNSSQGQNHSQQRNQIQHNNESHYIECNNGNSFVVKVEVTVITQQADPVTITAKHEETKTETETTTDKQDWYWQDNWSKPRQQQLTTQIQHPLPRVMQRILETLWSQEKRKKVNRKS